MDWSKDKIDNNNRGPKLSDKVEMLHLEDGGEFKAVRMIGPTVRVAKHLLPVFKNDGTPVIGKNKQQVRIPKVCLAYNSETNEYDRMVEDKETGKKKKAKCPYCDIDEGTPKIEAQTNVIDREIANDFNFKKYRKQYSKKEAKKRTMHGFECHVADGKASKKLTPVRFWIIKSSAGSKISDATALNKVKNKKTGKVGVFGPSHEKYGFDLNVKYDSKKAGTDMYAVVKDERNSLQEEEMEYLLWSLDADAPEDYKTAKVEAASFAKRMEAGAKLAGKDSGDDDDDDDRKSSKKSKKGKKNKAEEDDWNEDEDMEDDDDDDDEDDKKKKKGKKSKSKKSDDDDDDDDDSDDDESDDDDDEEEDDDDDDDDSKSKKKKGKDSKSSKKSKKRDDDDDDEDEDEDDDSDDEDDDDDEEDEDDVKKKKKGKKDKGKKKKSSDDDDDDEDEEDDDSDDDDDEDDEPKKKKGKDKKKDKKKKKSKDDDDDDDDDWDD